MSTYLVAFTINDFQNVPVIGDTHNATVNIWARRDAVVEGQTTYLKTITPKIFKYFETKNITYKLPKLDVIASLDFGIRGMENWGNLLILYSHINGHRILTDHAIDE